MRLPPVVGLHRGTQLLIQEVSVWPWRGKFQSIWSTQLANLKMQWMRWRTPVFVVLDELQDVHLKRWQNLLTNLFSYLYTMITIYLLQASERLLWSRTFCADPIPANADKSPLATSAERRTEWSHREPYKKIKCKKIKYGRKGLITAPINNSQWKWIYIGSFICLDDLRLRIMKSFMIRWGRVKSLDPFDDGRYRHHWAYSTGPETEDHKLW